MSNPATSATLPRVLIVDDQAPNIFMLHQLLSNQYTVLAATSAAQALTICAASPPDIILTDVVMPDMDGWELCRALKQNPLTANIPVIFITSIIDAKDEVQCWDVGGAEIVTKPVNPPTLRERMRIQLLLRQQALQLAALAKS
jgi:PleD family two-component response regulator